jgi:hypothetical protein
MLFWTVIFNYSYFIFWQSRPRRSGRTTAHISVIDVSNAAAGPSENQYEKPSSVDKPSTGMKQPAVTDYEAHRLQREADDENRMRSLITSSKERRRRVV